MSDGLGELSQVSQAVLSVTRQLSVHDVLQVIVRSARSLVGARYTALGVPDAGDSFAEFVVDGVSPAEWAAIGPLPRRHGMLAVLLREGKPERLADIRADPRFQGFPAAHPPMSHFLGVPVRDGDHVLGIIFAANKVTAKSSGFTERDEEILTLFATHAAIALTNARLYEQSREVSVLTERARLARELHDAVSQKLFSLRAHAGAARVLAARPGPASGAGGAGGTGGTGGAAAADALAAEMAAVESLAAEAHAELRAVIDGLAPPDLAAGGLAESVRRYAALAARAHRVPVPVTVARNLPELSADVEAALYRVAQEALHNALRHAAASSVRICLTRGSPLRVGMSRSAVLEVADDGQGFVVGGPSAGLGLASMRDRLCAVGGTLSVESAPGAGTRIRATVPAVSSGATR
jgi:signal transduction histidine kinase